MNSISLISHIVLQIVAHCLLAMLASPIGSDARALGAACSPVLSQFMLNNN